MGKANNGNGLRFFSAFAAICFALGVLVVLPFVPAILWAIVLSVLMWPIHQKVHRMIAGTRLPAGVKLNLGPMVTVIATLLIICVPFILVGIGLFVQLSGVSSDLGATTAGAAPKAGGFSLDAILQQVDTAAKPFFVQIGQKDFSILTYVNENRESLVAGIRAPAAKFAQSAGFTILTMVIALLTQFFMIRDGHRLLEPALDLIPLPRDKAEDMLLKVRDTIRAVFIGVVLVALVQSGVIGITYAALGIPNALLLSVASFLLCCLPLLGAPVLYIPVGLGMLLAGKTTEALWILGIGFLVVSQIDNLLRPFVIGARVNLHPMAIFFSLLGGVLAIGPIGLMAGPMLLTVLLAVVDVMRERAKVDAAEAPG